MIVNLLKRAAEPTTGDRYSAVSMNRTYQATATGNGPVAAKVIIEVSNDQRGWITVGTLEMSGDDVATDGFPTRAAWEHTRARLTEISGDSALVTVTMGC